MITDEDALAEEDLFILDKMKEMVSGPEVIHFGAAKQLLTLIERAVSLIRFLEITVQKLRDMCSKEARAVPRPRCPSTRNRFHSFPGRRGS
jgi:hypothetical protein